MGDIKFVTRTGKSTIIHITNGGLVVADAIEGNFKKDFPFLLKNVGLVDLELTVRLADQAPGETFDLPLPADKRWSDEMVVEVLVGIPESGLQWGA